MRSACVLGTVSGGNWGVIRAEWKIDHVGFAVRGILWTYECSLQDEFFTHIGLMRIGLNTSENMWFRGYVDDE